MWYGLGTNWFGLRCTGLNTLIYHCTQSMGTRPSAELGLIIVTGLPFGLHCSYISWIVTFLQLWFDWPIMTAVDFCMLHDKLYLICVLFWCVAGLTCMLAPGVRYADRINWARIRNHSFLCDVITHPCPDISIGLTLRPSDTYMRQ